MKPVLPTLGLFSAISATVLLAACGGGGSSTPPTATSGTLGVSMTDAPACGYDAVNVTVNKVRVNQSASASDTDAGWTDITLSPAKKINLLDLNNGALQALGETPLAAGHYSQLRLVLDPNTSGTLANSLVLTGTTNEISLDTPSAVQSGIKLVDEFDVVAGQRADIVLDFDACKSIVKKGNSGGYGLKPVVKVIPTILNGIDGFVSTNQLGNHVMVTAQQNGVIVSSTVPNTTTGEFYLTRLPVGNYDVVLTGDNKATAVISAVPVATTTSTAVVSTAATPITLQTAATVDGQISGLATLKPTSATEVAYVAAKQSFASGPVVTVKFQGADITTGAYALRLPTVAPQLAPYSTTLPLLFANQTTTTPGTGKYSVNASATGYTSATQPSVDISASNQTAINFTLMP